jgi:hypothetical protein
MPARRPISWSAEHQLQITTTICPTRSVLTVPDGPDRPNEIDDDALRDLDLSCELATTALPLNGGARPASPTLGAGSGRSSSGDELTELAVEHGIDSFVF